MGDPPQLRTERLLMRRWLDADREPFAALNADPRVMEFLTVRDRQESDDMIDRFELSFEIYGFGMWALQTLDSGRFIGLAGLANVGFTAHFTPAVEVGWRLAREWWGHGYATEAGRAALGYGFDVALLTEIVATAPVGNQRHRAVMRRLGMHRDPADDFLHPALPPDHPRARHVLYRLARSEWTNR